ncbi:MAG: DNA internalization-related competence protein ComEC/Rec2 [Sedimentisphaerales bacterium]|nr:DNA internalization-related competence protein ComEC/Rec2 [Sedimentisphaerales bacterium]
MNDIQRKLAEIDRELSRGPAYYFNQTIAAAPLVFCVVGLIAGIIIQNYLPIPVLFWLLLLSVCIVITVILFGSRHRLLPITVVLCFTCLGAIRLASFNSPAPNDIRNSVGEKPMLATIRGVIQTEPYIDKNDWSFARFAHTDPGSSFYLKITEAEIIDGWAKASGIIRVRVQEPVFDLKPGDCVQMYCLLNRFAGASNPGEFDIAKYLARKGVFVGASVKSRDAIEITQAGHGRLLTRIRTRLSDIATRRLTGELPTDDPTRGLVEALLLGSRGNINKDVYRAFRETGLLHFISLSGMHLAIIAGIGWWIGRLAGLMKRGQAAICIITVVVFVLTVPPRDPTIRAAIITIVFCVSFFFRRQPNSFNSLSLAAIILLLANPTGLFNAGWQLSFASVLGILAFYRRIHLFLYEKIAGHPWVADFLMTKPFFKIVSRPGPAILALFTTGLSAWTGSAGILLYHFYTINPLTSVWTAVAFPFVSLILIFGFLKVLLSFALPTLAGLLGLAVSLLANTLIGMVKFIAGLNISEILTGHTPIWLIAVYYALVLFIGLSWFKRPMPRRIICVATSIIILTYLGAVKWQRTYRNDLALTVLDIGHGQAIFAQLPGGANILFDAGSLSRDNVGERVILPFMQYDNLTKIDALVISHGDIDHINGIPEVAQNTQARDIFASDAFINDIRPTVKFLLDELKQKVKKIDNLPREFGPARMSTLWPGRDILENNRVSDNDKSIVTLIEYAGRQILIPSDVEKFAQAEILQLYPHLKADILIAPHHGSRKTLERKFLEVIQPHVVICSCTNTAFEKGQVIKQDRNFSSYYTGKDGAVTVRINQAGEIKTNTFRVKK